jgi:hypothetical protein
VKVYVTNRIAEEMEKPKKEMKSTQVNKAMKTDISFPRFLPQQENIDNFFK